MKYIIAILVSFLSLTSFGQKRIELSPYQKEMISLSEKRMSYHLNILAVKSRVHAYRPYSWLKLTFKTTMNSNIISKIKISEMVNMLESDELSLGEVIDYGLSDLDVSDYMSVMAYDIRAKIYFPPHSAIILRCFVTGIQLDTFNYMIGYSYKF